MASHHQRHDITGRTEAGSCNTTVLRTSFVITVNGVSIELSRKLVEDALGSEMLVRGSGLAFPPAGRPRACRASSDSTPPISGRRAGLQAESLRVVASFSSDVGRRLVLEAALSSVMDDGAVRQRNSSSRRSPGKRPSAYRVPGKAWYYVVARWHADDLDATEPLKAAMKERAFQRQDRRHLLKQLPLVRRIKTHVWTAMGFVPCAAVSSTVTEAISSPCLTSASKNRAV